MEGIYMKKQICLICVITLLFMVNMTAITVTAQTPTLSMSPNDIEVTAVNETFTVELKVENVQNLWGWSTTITWDPNYLDLAGECTEGDFMNSVSSTMFVPATPEKGKIPEISCLFLSSASASGSGVLLKMTFKMLKECIETSINLENTTLLSPEAAATPLGHAYISSVVGPTPLATVSCIGDSGLIAHAGSPQTVDEDTLVILNASRTRPFSEDLKFNWSFNDNGEKTLSGQIANYTFTAPRIYEVTLFVENSMGLKSNNTVEITVLDKTPPKAVITLREIALGETIDVDQYVVLDATQSYDPEGGTLKNYTWNLGDGSPIVSGGQQFSVNHQFSAVGTYTVTLTVEDRRANLTDTTSILLTVGNAPKETTQNLVLPPYAFAILISITVVTICGSAIWLNNVTLKKSKSEP